MVLGAWLEFRYPFLSVKGTSGLLFLLFGLLFLLIDWDKQATNAVEHSEQKSDVES